MTLRVFLCSILLLWLAPTVSLGQQPFDIADTLRQLRQVTVVDGIGYDVPPSAIPLLTQLKHQLLNTFREALKESGSSVTGAQVRQRMLSRLEEADVRIGRRDNGIYGDIDDVQVGRPSGHADLVVFVSTISIACGEDSSIYVFQRRNRRWRMVIAVERDGYKQVDGAIGNLQYGVSPPDRHGRWFLVYANISPWCTSFWNGLHYVAARAGTAANRPQVVREGTEAIYLGTDYGPRLKVGRDDFRLDFESDLLLDMGVMIRTHVVRYRVSGNHATRIPPLAHSPEGFLDEWSHLPWKEAARWSCAARPPRAWHDLLASDKYYSEFDFVQPCPDGRRWQIGVDLEPSENKPGIGRTVLATVMKRGQAYLLTQIGSRRPRGCPGEKAVEPEQQLFYH
jgi:hypothetical protein